MQTTKAKTTHKGRIYELTATTTKESHPALFAHLVAQGFDGLNYAGESQPQGRQRIAMFSNFYKSATTGEFICAI